jgi:hypothetical protein
LVYLESSPYSKCAVVARPPGLTDPSKAVLVGCVAEVDALFDVGLEPEPPLDPEGTATPVLVAGLEDPPSLRAITAQVSVWPWSAGCTAYV